MPASSRFSTWLGAIFLPYSHFLRDKNNGAKHNPPPGQRGHPATQLHEQFQASSVRRYPTPARPGGATTTPVQPQPRTRIEPENEKGGAKNVSVAPPPQHPARGGLSADEARGAFGEIRLQTTEKEKKEEQKTRVSSFSGQRRVTRGRGCEGQTARPPAYEGPQVGGTKMNPNR